RVLFTLLFSASAPSVSYTLSLHDALPISAFHIAVRGRAAARLAAGNRRGARRGRAFPRAAQRVACHAVPLPAGPGGDGNRAARARGRAASAPAGALAGGRRPAPGRGGVLGR